MLALAREVEPTPLGRAIFVGPDDEIVAVAVDGEVAVHDLRYEDAFGLDLVEEGAQRKIRMANLAIVGSHSTNGVAAIHSQLLRTTTVKDLADLFPERFSNKTNGVTPRRWLLLANPALARTITDRRQ